MKEQRTAFISHSMSDQQNWFITNLMLKVVYHFHNKVNNTMFHLLSGVMVNRVASSVSTRTCFTTLARERSSTWKLTTPAEAFNNNSSNSKTLPEGQNEVRHFRPGCSTRLTVPATSAPTARRRPRPTNVGRGLTATTTEMLLPATNLQSMLHRTID